ARDRRWRFERHACTGYRTAESDRFVEIWRQRFDRRADVGIHEMNTDAVMSQRHSRVARLRTGVARQSGGNGERERDHSILHGHVRLTARCQVVSVVEMVVVAALTSRTRRPATL